MKTFLTLLLYFPFYCGAQELPDSVSWFRINGITYYSRDSKGKFTPAVVEYKLAVETAPALGYTHTARIIDSLENANLVFSIGAGANGQPKTFSEAGKYAGGGMAKIQIVNEAKNIDDDIIYSADCKPAGYKSNLVVEWTPDVKLSRLKGKFQANVYRTIGLLNEFDCTMTYGVDGYFSAVYAPAPERKSKK
jgi:hypothetical protein